MLSDPAINAFAFNREAATVCEKANDALGQAVALQYTGGMSMSMNMGVWQVSVTSLVPSQVSTTIDLPVEWDNVQKSLKLIEEITNVHHPMLADCLRRLAGTVIVLT